MIIFKCDVCGATKDAPSSVAGPYRIGPVGWRDRTGRTPDTRMVRVHTCSERCAARYDLAEAEQVGGGRVPFLPIEEVAPVVRALIVPEQM